VGIESRIPVIKATDRVDQGHRLERVAAVVEVLSAFAVVHVTFRALKYFTELGRLEGAARLNFIPGTVMIVFTVFVLLFCGRNLETYGLTMKRWSYNVNIGLLWSVMLVALAGLGLVLTRVHFDPAHPHNDAASRLGGAAFGGVAVVLLVWTSKRQGVVMDRLPPILGVLFVVALLSVPLVVAMYFNQPLGKVLANVGWLFFGAGFGEEIFFRGYIQSRVNQAFGRPFRLLGINFGFGLLVSSLLFGFLHALNSVDYFHGNFNFAWWYGVQSIFVGLFYGCLREKTGSVVAGSVTHGLTDVLATVPGLVSAP
jgi:membrane protease YdiL (CAAX protease family)